MAQSERTPVPGRRVDAQRNRVALVRAAREAFTAGQVDLRMEEIARRAGVGVGTLYRHFPTRQALLEEVYRARLDELCDAAVRLSAELPPGPALHRFMAEFIHYTASGRGMATALEALVSSGTEVFAEGRRRMVDALATVLAPAVRAGVVRGDISAEFLFRGLGGICTNYHLPDWADGARRLIDVVYDGLRAEPQAP